MHVAFVHDVQVRLLVAAYVRHERIYMCRTLVVKASRDMKEVCSESFDVYCAIEIFDRCTPRSI
jgi:hypothetical protein